MDCMRSAESPFQLKPTMSSVLSVIALLFGVSPAAHAGTTALPSGGQFVAGSGSINGSGSTLTINQSSSRGVIDWKSFSIANGRHVTFNNGSGATLNRVTGGDPTLIAGSLSATGSVYLINPQGVVVGPSGTVSTGGRFVASTLDTDNTAFMSGGPLTLTGNSSASVYNLGKIGSSGGDVFLVGAKEVDNFGTIDAPKGTAEVASGRQVLLQDSSSSRQVFVQTGSVGTVRNAGAIAAAQISLQAADGNIYALSGNHEALRASGTAQRDGHVWLVADTGAVQVAGALDAHNVDGSGGTVDTFGGTVGLRDAGSVSARAWNITAPALFVTAGDAAALARALSGGTAVNVQTTGAGNASGDIEIGSNIAWNGAASLSIGAHRNVGVDAGVTLSNQGSGNLTLRADNAGLDNGGKLRNSGIVDWSQSTGVATLLYDISGAYTPGTLRSNAMWAAPAQSGLVTQITAYQLVNSVRDLWRINNNLGGNYALGEDIDANNATLLPLGVGLQGTGTAFTGQFDGFGHTIDRLSPTSGLFLDIGASGVVRNLGVTHATATGNDAGYAVGNGLLADLNEGLVVNDFTSGTQLNPQSTPVGGLVGINKGKIERAWSSAAVTGSNGLPPIGGLVGENDGTINQSFSTGTVTIGFNAVGGGLVGHNTGTIAQSYSTGPVIGSGALTDWGVITSNAVGGLVGTNDGTIQQSFSSSSVSLSLYTVPSVMGSITGSGTGTVGTDVYWNADATGPWGGGPGATASNGLTAAQMRQVASFKGWNFGPSGDWAMPAGSAHPVLRWQLAQPSSSGSGAPS